MIKKLLLLSSFIAFTACVATGPKRVSQFSLSSHYYLLDFSRHSNDGFFITTETPEGNYTPIGLVGVKIDQGAKEIEEKEVLRNGMTKTNKYWVKDTINTQMALDSLVAMARALGADAIVSFKDEAHFNQKYYSSFETIELVSVSVSGFAIKREEVSNENSTKPQKLKRVQ